MSLLLETFIIGAIVLLIINFIYVEFPSLRTVRYVNKIKGPRGLPFGIGIIINLITLGSGGVLDYLKEVTTKYERLTSAYMAGIPCVIVQKAHDLKHILGSNKNIQKGFEYQILLPWLNEGLLTSYGTKWHMRRKLLTPTFHFKILEDGLSRMTQNVELLADKLQSTNGESVVVDDYITRCTLDIIGETAMGVQLEAQNEIGKEYLTSIKEAAALSVDRVLSIYQMKDWIHAISWNGWLFRNSLKILHGFTDKVIAEKKKTKVDPKMNVEEDIFGRKRRKAFLDCLLDMQTANPESFTDKDIREEVDTIMFEGHDTTSTALCFGLWLLGCNPDIQERVYQEIMEIVGHREMTMKDVNNMQYLEKIIKETLRLYPSVPYISRRLSEDVVLDDGVILPANCNIIMLPYLIHRDPEVFPDPEKFDPERFTEEASKDRHPYAYIPFSAGPRNCIGQKFAMLEMKVTLASVIRKVRIEAVTKKSEFKIVPHLIIRPTVPLKCNFIPRR